jgi:hypothetical protein
MSNGCLDVLLYDEVVWVDFGVGFFLVRCEEGGGGWVGKGDVRLFLGTSLLDSSLCWNTRSYGGILIFWLLLDRSLSRSEQVKTLLAGPSPISPMKAEITISPISNTLIINISHLLRSLIKSLSPPRFTSLPPSHLTSLPLSPSSVSHPHPLAPNPTRVPTLLATPPPPKLPHAHTPTFCTTPFISSHLIPISTQIQLLMQPPILSLIFYLLHTQLTSMHPHPLIYSFRLISILVLSSTYLTLVNPSRHWLGALSAWMVAGACCVGWEIWGW